MSDNRPNDAANRDVGNVSDATDRVDVALEYCSVISRQQQVDPIGTAPAHQRYLFVEVPSPWERQVVDSRHFPEGLRETLARCEEKCAAPTEKFRFLAFNSDAHRSPAGHARVIYFWRPTFPCSQYQKREYVVPLHELNELAEALLLNTDGLSAFDRALQPTEQIRDIFVCAHGARDRCCGKFGVPVYQFIEEHYGDAASRAGDESGESIRVWRVSHIGGHRYAPTFIDFPEGRYWANATEDMLRKLIERKGSPAEIATHCRGWGMIGRFEQAAERELFTRFGWDWVRYDKEAEVIDSDERSARVRIRYRSPDGKQGEYNAEVLIAGKARIGGCGKEWSEINQYTVRSIEESGAY